MNPITTPDGIAAELQRRLSPDNRGKNGNGEHRYMWPIPRIECADGFSVSIQAKATDYCLPRDDSGPWHAVECGLPSAPMPELAQWAEYEKPTATVWGFVPLKNIIAVLTAHGGVVASEFVA